MGSVALVEILDRRGGVSRRVPLPSLPAVVGRSCHADVVLDDPYACPTHLRLSRTPDGGLLAEDLGSLNGSFRQGAEAPEARIPLGSGGVLRVGRTLLRVRGVGEELAPTRKERQRRLSALGRTPAALGIVALCAGDKALEEYLRSYGPIVPMEIADLTLDNAAAAAVWAGAWSVLNRIVAGEFRFAVHWAIISVGVVALDVGANAVHYLIFLGSPDRIPQGLESVGRGLVISAIVFGHLTVFSILNAGRRAGLALVATASVFIVIEVSERAEEEQFRATLEFPGQIRPLAPRWLPARSPDSFFATIVALRAEVDALAAEEPKPDRG